MLLNCDFSSIEWPSDYCFFFQETCEADPRIERSQVSWWDHQECKNIVDRLFVCGLFESPICWGSESRQLKALNIGWDWREMEPTDFYWRAIMFSTTNRWSRTAWWNAFGKRLAYMAQPLGRQLAMFTNASFYWKACATPEKWAIGTH